MENASKALIIAGAILLSILLISLGVLVYNNAKDTATGTNLDSEKAQTFNDKISSYCGKNKSASNMNGLVSAISASNGAQKGKSDQHFITITIKDIEAVYYTGGAIDETQAKSAGSSYPNFSAGVTYQASYTTDAAGYINAVTISKNSTDANK